MFLAFSIAGFVTMFSNNSVVAAEDDNGMVDTVTSVPYVPETTPTDTFYLGRGGIHSSHTFYFAQFSTGWAEAVQTAKNVYDSAEEKDKATTYVKVILVGDWIAGTNVDNGTSFGTTPAGYTQCFTAGRIYVPAGVNIVLDLNGRKIDRALINTDAQRYGQVMLIKGNLTLLDSSVEKTGLITGGYNTYDSTSTNTEGAITGYSSYGGGLQVDGGTLNMYGGTIASNKAIGDIEHNSISVIYGIGVSLRNEAKFNMYGGNISDNAADNGAVFGGGVGLYVGAMFNMYGGVIENNTATYGGGVACYASSNTAGKDLTITIDGGVIRKNRAVLGKCQYSVLLNTVKAWGGGGIGLFLCGKIDFKSGAISSNFSDNYGGGILSVVAYAYGNGIISVGKDAKIHHNVVASMERNVYGAGIAQKKMTASATAEVTLDGGSISNNMLLSYNNSVFVLDENDEFVKNEDGENKIYNSSIPGRKTYTGNGVGVYIYNGLFTMESGEICNNDGYIVRDADISNEDFNKVVDKFFAGESIAKQVMAYAIIYGGGVQIYNSRTGPVGLFKMNGGSIYNNIGWSGGGIYNQGDFEMNGGSIYNNYGLYGGAIYNTAKSTITLSGMSTIKDNYFLSKYDSDGDGIGDQYVEANVEIAAADERRIQFTGELEEGSNIHVYTTENLIKSGQAITKNYGEYNRVFIPYNGIDKEPKLVEKTNEKGEPLLNEAGEAILVPTNGVYVYANPYRYFSSDTVFHIEGTDVKMDSTVTQHFMVLSGTYTASRKNASNKDEYYTVNADGEIGVARDPITFRVYFSDKEGDYKDYSYGNVGLNEDNMWNYATFTYGDAKFPTKVEALVKGKAVADITKYVNGVAADGTAVGKNVGIYTFTAVPKEPDNEKDKIATTASFHIVVLPKEMKTGMDNLTITISGHDNYTYDGNAKTPDVDSVTYKFSEEGNLITLVKATDKDSEGDYWVTYDKNINAGLDTAEVIINFKGNYVGTAIKNFTIKSSTNQEISTDVSWEVYDGEEWKSFVNNTSVFTYNGKNQDTKVRARLTPNTSDVSDEQTVYVGEYKSDDEQQNTSMHLSFSIKEGTQFKKADEFKDAGTYSVHIEGTVYTNYPIKDEDRTLTEIEMAKKTLAISANDFANPVNEGVKLWTLLIDSGKETYSTSTLLDSATYIDPENGTDNGYGVKVSEGTTVDSYARYRGAKLSLELNEAYKFTTENADYETVGDLIAYASSVSEAEWVTGKLNEVTTVTTTIVISFGSNYIVGEDNTVTVTKTWYIVTMTNDLLNADTATTVEDKKLEGWTYANLDELLVYVFRPEHGDTVIYSYKLNGSAEAPKAFALVYSDDTSSAVRRVYKVTTDASGKYVVDTSSANLLGDESYLYTFNYELIAGIYTVTVTVPQPVVGDGHKHWFDGDSVGDDNGVMYYEFTYAFTLEIKGYEANEDSFKEGGDVKVVFPDEVENFVYYTGEANNIVKNITITLFGKTLIKDVDYELTSVSVNAGKASLTIRGISSNFRGTYTIQNAFTIKQAINGWYDVPSMTNWTFSSFDRKIVLISAMPNFGYDSMTFKVARDEDGNDIIADNIVLDKDGYVSDDVAKTLNQLEVGKYWLFAHVAENTNYSKLDNSVDFQVFAATNVWESKTVNRWIQGEYISAEENLHFISAFGDVHIIITGDKDGKVYYDNFEGIDNLAKAKHGNYTLKAEVAGTSNYSGLDTFTFEFEIFKQPGLPWWATLLIAVGSLAVAALIIFILWKKGVFQILTEKLFVSIRTRASVEATIASVRAAKMMEEGRQSVAEAKRRERIEMLRKKAQEEREMSPEERAAKLEAKAQADAEKAEKLRKRSEAAQKRAERLLNQESSSAGSTDNHETPTEE